MRARMPWWEGVKLALLAAGVWIAWLLYQRLSTTADTIDKNAAPIASLGSGAGNFLDSIGNWIAGK